MPDYKNEPAGIEKLLPWGDFIKERCSGLIDVENQTPEHHNKLFFLEKLFRDLTSEERKDRRLETEVPVWESFYAWLEQLNPVKRSKLEKAVIYAKNHKEPLPV